MNTSILLLFTASIGAGLISYFTGLPAYHEAAILGLAVYVLKKYVVADGWNLARFFRTGLRQIALSVVTTASIIYLTPDAVKLLDLVPAPAGMEKLAAVLDAVPRFLGFFTGVTGGTLGYDLLKMLGPIPFLGPLVSKYLGEKNDAKP